MQWYLATLIFEIRVKDATVSQFDVQHRLFQAPNKKEATDKAHRKGVEETHFFYSDSQQAVRWEFIGIKAIEPVQLADGITLLEETQELSPEEAVHFVAFVRRKHQEILKKPDQHRVTIRTVLQVH